MHKCFPFLEGDKHHGKSKVVLEHSTLVFSYQLTQLSIYGHYEHATAWFRMSSYTLS